ncbi:hypothetical protein [Methanolobus profundi]|uniref:Uncharacterized protein n=1 Tax=Methanolobus profundi TaxID=487685 RepID=A0A1I4Q2B8_9EURY|nr:hypothetical protein [Methanolobus profundi]SFM33785.1 hypothetical protein SAMN04488696_1035 [Methanolobus profundi]
MANLDVQRLRKDLLKYYSKFNVLPINTYELSASMDAGSCAEVIDDITSYLLKPMEKNIRLELSQMFKNCENPEIPYFEVVMDIMQFMNEFVGDPHTVELIFARVNNDVARKKLEVEDKVYYQNDDWTSEAAEAAMQKLRDSGTERDYQYMIDQLTDVLSHFTTAEGTKSVRMKLNNIIKDHSQRELKTLDTHL